MGAWEGICDKAIWLTVLLICGLTFLEMHEREKVTANRPTLSVLFDYSHRIMYAPKISPTIAPLLLCLRRMPEMGLYYPTTYGTYI